GIFLYDETLHVPLLIKLPLNRGAGERIETRAGLLDVAPTLLDAAGLNTPKEMQGESLLTLLKTKSTTPTAKKPGQSSAAAASASEPPDRPAYAETDYPHRGFGWSSLRALRTGKYLYIRAPDRELYDQSADPEASHNLAPTARAVADTLSFQLDQFRQKSS